MKPQHIPNALCVFRIVLVAPLAWYVLRGDYVIAFVLFGLAGFTDGLDGFLARHFDWRSRLGGILDPLADKLLMTTMFVSLALAGLIPVWLAALVIGRDLVILLGGIAYRLLIGRFHGRATVVSKVNTATVLLFVLCVLGSAAFGLPAPPAILALGAVVMASAIVSGLDYVRTWGVLAWENRPGAAQ